MYSSLGHPATGSFDDLVATLATWVLLAGSVWGALIGAAVLVETTTAGRVRALSWVAMPPALRRALVTTLGLALAGGLPGPVSAEVRRHPAPTAHRSARLALPVPERLPEPGASGSLVTVRPGDTLWALARARLPRAADGEQLLAAVHRWHECNRAVVGADPDLILPGQRLSVPGEPRR